MDAASQNPQPTEAVIYDIREIWQLLSDQERQDAAEAFLSDPQNYQKVEVPLSQKLRFRPVSLQRQSRTWQAAKLKAYVTTPEFAKFLPDLLKALHLIPRRDMLTVFLDAAGIPHADGCIDGDLAGVPSPEALLAGYQALAGRFPKQHILIYFRALLALEGTEDTWQNLSGLLRQIEHNGLTKSEPGIGPSEDAKIEHLPESSEEFTSLDNLLIQAIVNTALNVEGALAKEQLDDLTDEFLHLNGTRKQSFFHRGFFDALFSTEANPEHDGENVESRLWYVAGAVMGWTRRRMPERIVELFSEDRGLLEEFTNDRNSFRIRMLLPILYPLFFEKGIHQDAIGLLNAGLPALAGTRKSEMLHRILNDAAALLREGDPTTALAYIKSLGEFDLSGDELPSALAAFARKLIRKKSQCLQMLGQMEAAEAGLKRLSELGDFEESIEAVTDLGLIMGSFQSLYEILPGENQEAFTVKLSAIERGKPFFQNAVSREITGGSVRSRNAHFALGILELFSFKNPHEAAKHLAASLVGMSEEESVYRIGHLLDWAKLLLGLSLLETCDEARVNSAASNIRFSLQDDARFPPWVLIQCLEASALFEDAALSSLISDAVLKHAGANVFPKIRSANVLQKMPTTLGKYIEWVATATLSVQDRATEWVFALKTSLSAGKIELAERSLDVLESLAYEWSDFADPFLDLLKDPSNFSPAWSPYDAEEAAIRVLEAKGRFEEAAELLKQRFWAARAERSAESRVDCESILAALEEMGRPGDELDQLRQNLPTLTAPDGGGRLGSDSALDRLRSGTQVSILFVGGNETQAQYDQQIRNEITASFPGASIQFEHPGWGSNWAPLCDEIERNLGSYDAVVLSHLVRTNMGRRLRKMCGAGTPWFACRGKGAASIRRSIEDAALRSVELRRINPQV